MLAARLGPLCWFAQAGRLLEAGVQGHGGSRPVSPEAPPRGAASGCVFTRSPLWTLAVPLCVLTSPSPKDISQTGSACILASSV